MKDRKEVTLEVSGELAARDNRIAELEQQLDRANAQLVGQPPVPNMVSFVGGPLHGSDHVLRDEDINRRRYAVPVAVPAAQLESWFVDPVGRVSTGDYAIITWQTRASHLPYYVAIWEGLR